MHFEQCIASPGVYDTLAGGGLVPPPREARGGGSGGSSRCIATSGTGVVGFLRGGSGTWCQTDLSWCYPRGSARERKCQLVGSWRRATRLLVVWRWWRWWWLWLCGGGYGGGGGGADGAGVAGAVGCLRWAAQIRPCVTRQSRLQEWRCQTSLALFVCTPRATGPFRAIRIRPLPFDTRLPACERFRPRPFESKKTAGGATFEGAA